MDHERLREDGPLNGPDGTAVRTALWRALHVLVDAPPPVLDDLVGLELAAPDEGWQDRGDMHPEGTRLFRASIVARARFLEDLVEEQASQGVGQYVLLGAGLDTFAQRRSDIAARLRVFEIDRGEPQAWKRHRLVELGYGVPDWLRLVPVDFEAESWWERLVDAGFSVDEPAVVASTGVSMYLTAAANAATLRGLAGLAPGSRVVVSFLLPLDLLDGEERAGLQRSSEGARASGTPFVSLFPPDEMVALAESAGLAGAHVVGGDVLNERYFDGRTDGLRTGTAEQLLVATVG